MPDAWSAAIDGFLHNAAVERGLSPRTIEAYASDLARLATHATGAGAAQPAALSRPVLSGFLESLSAAGLSPRSRARMLVSARRFAHHLVATGRLERDPTEGIAAPRQERRLPRTLRRD